MEIEKEVIKFFFLLCVCFIRINIYMFSGKNLDGNYTRMLCAVLQQILEAATHKLAVVQLLASHLANRPRKTSKTAEES